MQLNNEEREFALLLLCQSDGDVARINVEELKDHTLFRSPSSDPAKNRARRRRRRVESRLHALWNAGLRIERDEQGDRFCHIRDFIAQFGVDPDALREQLAGTAGGGR